MRKLLLLLFSLNLYSQVGINTSTPNSDALLEVYSNDKGILLPRVVLAATNLPNPMSSHVAGMVVFNTVQAGTGFLTVYPGLYYDDGHSWIRLNPNTTKIGDIKHSFATTDSNGWYLLNGRAVTSLPAIPKANAITLGYATNLANTDNTFLKGKSGAEILGQSGGNATFAIVQNNLPNVNFIGTTDSTGAHTHDVDSFLGNENIGLLTTNALTVFHVETVANDSMQTIARTTQTTGNHTHTVAINSGGTDAPVDRTPSYIATNIFIYLGN